MDSFTLTADPDLPILVKDYSKNQSAERSRFGERKSQSSFERIPIAPMMPDRYRLIPALFPASD